MSGTNDADRDAEVPDTVLYYHPDHLGSSNIITNSAGNLIGNYEYLPYGEFSTKEDSNTTNYHFENLK